MRITVQSFGFKKSGIPQNTEQLFDVRHLPNPHDVPALRELNGLHPKVREYLNLYVPAMEFDAIAQSVMFGEANVISVGCTGGKHRSVYIVERLARLLESLGHDVTINHIEIGG